MKILSELGPTPEKCPGLGVVRVYLKRKQLKKRRVLQCFLSSAEGHDRTYGTNILKIIFEGTEKARNVVNYSVLLIVWSSRAPKSRAYTI